MNHCKGSGLGAIACSLLSWSSLLSSPPFLELASFHMMYISSSRQTQGFSPPRRQFRALCCLLGLR